jgi:hypothetical protein
LRFSGSANDRKRFAQVGIDGVKNLLLFRAGDLFGETLYLLCGGILEILEIEEINPAFSGFVLGKRKSRHDQLRLPLLAMPLHELSRQVGFVSGLFPSTRMVAAANRQTLGSKYLRTIALTPILAASTSAQSSNNSAGIARLASPAAWDVEREYAAELKEVHREIRCTSDLEKLITLRNI